MWSVMNRTSISKDGVTSISKDGLLVVHRQQPLSRPIELIVVPRSSLDGLLTAIYIKFDHPSKNQLHMVMQRHFFALDMSAAITRVSDSCHTCTSLKKFPSSLASQSSKDPPEVVGVSFAADIKEEAFRILGTTTQYQPSVATLKEVLMEKWNLIQNQPLLRKFFQEPPIISYN